MNENYILNFQNLSKEDTQVAGGKGASLGEMTQAGLSVPPGFVILTSAFEHFLEATDLNVEIESILDTVDHQAVHTVENASEQIQGLILSQEIPNSISQEILESFQSLSTKFVAVRSSATSEDSADAAWAGQLDTFLNTTEDKLIENIKKCWASLFTPRAIFYRFEKGLHESHISVAVVVQKMVNSEKSGIAFSVHPVTEDYNQIIIEAGFGLGEAIVSGSVTPDSYVTDKHNNRILDINVNTQSKGLYRKPDGGNEWVNLAEKGQEQVLSEAEILRLSQEIIKIENHYGFPCDIEWAQENGEFYITQSRPITTLSENTSKIEPENIPAYEKVNKYGVKYDPKLIQKNLKIIQEDTWYRQRFDACPHFMFFLGISHVTSVQKTNYPYGQTYTYAGFSENIADWYHSINELRNTADQMISRSNSSKNLGQEMIDDFQKWSEDFYKKCLEIDKYELSNLNNQELLQLYDSLADIYIKKLNSSGLIDGFALSTDTEIANKIKKHLLNLNLEEKFTEYFSTLTAHNYLSFLQIEELDFLKTIKTNQSLKAHQKKYFWMQNNYVDDNILETKDFELRKSKVNLKEIDKKIESLEKYVETKLSLKNKLIEELKLPSEIISLLEITDHMSYWQDERKKGTFWATHYFSKLLNEFSKRSQYTTDQLKYVFPTEMDLVLENQIPLKEIKKRISHCIIFWNIGNYAYTTEKNLIQKLDKIGRGETSHEDQIMGFAAETGKATGPVKVLNSVKDIHKIQEGDILVAVMTRPDYLPAMQKAKAFVTDEGGITCHAAIVSREMKKPCIIGTKNATQILNDGDLVEVDADTGIVKLLKKSQSKTDIINIIKQTSYEQDWESPFSILNSDLGSRGYFKPFEKTVGCSLSHVLITSKNGIMTGYLPTNQYEKVGNTLASKITQNEFRKKWIHNFKEVTDTLINYFKLNTESFLNNIDSLDEIYRTYVTYQVGSKMVYNFFPLNTDPKILNEIEEARKYSEDFFKFSDQKIIDVCEYIQKDNPSYTPKEIQSLLAPELKTYLKNKSLPPKDILEKRYKFSASYLSHDTTLILNQNELQEIEDFWKPDLDTETIQGTSAFKGKITGKVKIIKDYKNADLKQGDILVTGMTDPNFVPLMKKAGAIITNSGGLLCHAAIVSRELEIPCIIGTKFATQILNDGDLVEVDAENGVVKILEKSKSTPIPTYEKVFTRDFTLAMLEVWYKGEAYDPKPWSSQKQAKLPYIIFIREEGTVKSYYDPQGVNWIQNHLLETIQNSNDFLSTLEKEVKKDLTKIQPIYEGEKALNKEQLIKFIQDFQTAYPWIEAMWWLCEMSESQLKGIDISKIKNLREATNSLSTGTDIVVRKSLKRIYPQLKDYIHVLSLQEIESENFPDKETLMERDKSFIFTDNKIFTNKSISEIEDLHQIKLEEEISINSNSLKGTIAQKGKVKGIVRKVMGHQDINKMQAGEILVSPMTMPDFMPAIQKAAAIITDEGGLTCHAAIVARELKTPCVVGTKFATEILNDGDLVEVDAENGLVNILQKKFLNFVNFQNKEWKLAVSRNMSFWHQILSNRGHYFHSQDFGLHTKVEFLTLSKNGKETSAFIYSKNIQEYSQEILNLISSENKLKALEEKYNNLAKKLLNSTEQVKLELNPKTWENFLENYKIFCAGLLITTIIGRQGDLKLRELLKNNNYSESETNQIIPSITYPSKHTPLFQSQLELLEIGEKIQNKNFNSNSEKQKSLKIWLNKYKHIPVNFCEKAWNIEDAEIQLQSLLKKNCRRELIELKQNHREKTQTAQDQLKKIQNKEILNLANSIAIGTYLNEYRKNIFSYVSLQVQSFFKQIAAITGSNDWEDCFYLSPEETLNIVKGKKVNINKIKKSRKEVISYLKDDDFIYDTSENTKKFSNHIKPLHQNNNKSQKSEIKGTIANPGLIKGIVKIILNSNDFPKFNSGDILVSTMTSVDFVPIMEKAAAFVTNEGGITSHASIVAREMNKPCIIGTQNVTQILNDGDLVEVDANTGIIRILFNQKEENLENRKQNSNESKEISSLIKKEINTENNIISRFTKSIKYMEVEKWEGNFSLLLLGTGIGGCLYPYSEKYDFDFGQWMFVVNNKHGVAFVDLEKYIETTLNAYRKYVNQRGKLKELSDFNELWKQANSSYELNSPVNLEKMSDNELRTQIKASFDLMRNIIGSTVFVESLDEKQIRTHFNNIKSKKDFKTFFENVSMPVFESFTLRMDKQILKNTAPEKLQYIFADYYLVPTLTETSKKVENYISEKGGLSAIKEEINRIENDWKLNMKKISKFRSTLNNELALLFDFAQICMYTRDIRKDPLQKAQSIISNTVREFFKRKGINPEYAAFALYNDFETKKSEEANYTKEIERRKNKGCSVLFSDKEILFDYGETSKKLDSIFSAMKVKSKSQIVGNVAYKGKVKGTAKIVLSEKDFPKLKSGEVLVTSMTRPEFVPLMKKASAIITDEGGITCHAAIVSREMQKPCIIGTQNATQILNDGDLVEVDAKNGVVKILEKSESKKLEWHKLLARENVDIPTISQIDISFYDLIRETTNNQNEVFFTTLHNKKMTHYIGVNQKEIGQKLYQKYFNSPEQILEHYEEGKLLKQEIEAQTKKWSSQLHNNSNTSDLLQAWKDFTESFKTISYIYSITSWLAIEEWQKDFDQILNQIIQDKKLENQSEKIFSSAYQPWKKTALIEIQDKLRAGNSPEDLVKEYQFLRSWVVVWNSPITKQWIEEIQDNSSHQKDLYTEQELINLLEADQKTRHFIKSAPYIVFFKDWRDDLRRYHAYNWNFIFDLLEERFSLNEGEIGFFTLDEIEDIIQENKIDKSIIERRKKSCIISLDDTQSEIKMKVIDENIPKKYLETEEIVKQQNNSEIVKGIIAQKGIVTGTAKVIHSYHDLKRINSEDILVVNTTHPNYLPAMKKALAFVTNEGGMISHAAIVARELNKPCIVGTKNATQIIQDGDLIEVDANKGIVKIINE